jgi:hypothetical protein
VTVAIAGFDSALLQNLSRHSGLAVAGNDLSRGANGDGGHPSLSLEGERG